MLTTAITTSPAPAMPTTLRYIQNGDALNTANHLIQAEDVAQGLGHLKGTMAPLASPTFTGTVTADDLTATGTVTLTDVTITGTERVKLASRSITRVRQLHGVFDATRFQQDTATCGYSQISVASAGEVRIPFHVPHGATLTGVTLYVRGDPGAHGALPATMPAVDVRRYDTQTYSPDVASVATQTDVAPTVLAYESIHSISVTGMAEVVDATRYYYVAKITGETGANSAISLAISGMKVKYTITAYDED